jgi:hypothetical protein
MFHIDGPGLLRFVTEYACAPSEDRSSLVFAVNPPSLASTLNSIATGRLQATGMSDYADSVLRGSEMYQLLLRQVVATLEGEDDAELSNHATSEALRRSLMIPGECQHRGSELKTRAVVAIANEAIQRFSQLHWRRLTDMIARANKTEDVDSAKLTIPPFVLSANTEDSVSRVYGATAPGNGTYPDDFVDLDIVIDDSTYSRFAAPIEVLPSAALAFLESQSAALRSQIDKVVDLVERKPGESGEATIYVPSPDSARVFSNRFWAEHILWQVAFREVLLDEGVSLDPAKFQTYGLH